jgi:hypothetical protein
MPIDTNVTITPQNLVDYYKEFVVDVANADIAWALTGGLPFAGFPTSYLQGTTNGRPIGITGANVGTAGNLIDASDIYDVLTAETANYTSIRKIRALLFVEGAGGNTGTYSSAGYVIDETRKAYMSSSYLQPLATPQNGNVVTGEITSAGNLESLFANLVNAYANEREDIVTVQVNVCHASCHSSCHGSRGRR